MDFCDSRPIGSVELPVSNGNIQCDSTIKLHKACLLTIKWISAPCIARLACLSITGASPRLGNVCLRAYCWGSATWSAFKTSVVVIIAIDLLVPVIVMQAGRVNRTRKPNALKWKSQSGFIISLSHGSCLCGCNKILCLWLFKSIVSDCLQTEFSIFGWTSGHRWLDCVKSVTTSHKAFCNLLKVNKVLMWLNITYCTEVFFGNVGLIQSCFYYIKLDS